MQVDDPQPVGNTTGGSWHGVISNFSANPEAAYSLLSLMAIKPVSMWNAQHGWTGVDPGYAYQILEPNGEAKVEDYVKAGWDPRTSRTTAGLLRQLLRPDDADLSAHPGRVRVLGHHGQEPVGRHGRQQERQQALDATAAAWEQITDRIGRDSQPRDYQAAIGYEG